MRLIVAGSSYGMAIDGHGEMLEQSSLQLYMQVQARVATQTLVSTCASSVVRYPTRSVCILAGAHLRV